MGTHPIFESDFDCLTDFLLSKSHALQKMYKLDIPLDQKEAAAINRRKQNEEERQNRIFNARTRLIGVDKEALNHQVNDRNKMQQMDQQRHDAYAREMIKNDKLGVLYQERQERDVRELQKSLNEFRLQHQRPETRREWDMNNPEYLRIDKPARTSDDDKTLGISSAQVLTEKICRAIFEIPRSRNSEQIGLLLKSKSAPGLTSFAIIRIISTNKNRLSSTNKGSSFSVKRWSAEGP